MMAMVRFMMGKYTLMDFSPILETNMATLFLIKLVVVITVVVGLSIIAEHGSPRLAGLLSGYPTGSAITLFFFGLELSPQFAAHSAVYNMIGMVAMQVLIYAYYKTSCRHGIIASSLVGVGSYFSQYGSYTSFA
jgi:hypothetical protein